MNTSPKSVLWTFFTAGLAVVSHAYTVTINLPSDGSVSVSPAGGTYEDGATVSFTATSGSRKFVRWYGDVAEDTISNATMTVTVSKNLSLTPYFAPTCWDYNPNAKTLTDGYWVFNTSLAGDALTITGRKTTPSINMLDLSAPVNQGNYRIVALSGQLFRWYGSLHELVLPSTLQTIDDFVFDGCSNLKLITPFFPDSLTYLGAYAFQGCSSLTGDMSILSETFEFGGSTQFQSTKVTSVDFGVGVTQIPESTFRWCSSMTNVIFRGKLTSIGNLAFDSNSKLKTVTPFLPDTLTHMGESAFLNCSALTGDLALRAKSFSFSGNSQFLYDAKITSVELGSSVTNVPRQAFQNCTSMTNVVLLGATSLDANSFSYSNPENIYFGQKPTWVNESSFAGHPTYTRFHVARDNAEWDAFVNDSSLMTPWENLSTSTQASYTSRFHDEPLPLGRTTSASGLSEGWILRWTVPTPLDLITIIRLQ